MYTYLPDGVLQQTFLAVALPRILPGDWRLLKIGTDCDLGSDQLGRTDDHHHKNEVRLDQRCNPVLQSSSRTPVLDLLSEPRRLRDPAPFSKSFAHMVVSKDFTPSSHSRHQLPVQCPFCPFPLGTSSFFSVSRPGQLGKLASIERPESTPRTPVSGRYGSFVHEEVSIQVLTAVRLVGLIRLRQHWQTQ